MRDVRLWQVEAAKSECGFFSKATFGTTKTARLRYKTRCYRPQSTTWLLFLEILDFSISQRNGVWVFAITLRQLLFLQTWAEASFSPDGLPCGDLASIDSSMKWVSPLHEDIWVNYWLWLVFTGIGNSNPQPKFMIKMRKQVKKKGWKDSMVNRTLVLYITTPI